MIGYAARRAIHAVPVLFGLSLIAFLLVRLTPGDPIRIMLGIRATPDAITHWRAYYQLDDPLWVQYVGFIKRVMMLDFGESIQMRVPVATLLSTRLPTTIELLAYSMVISVSLAIPLATLSAVKATRWPDQVVKLATMVAFAMPAFWVGLTLTRVFSLQLGWFPASGLRDGFLPLLWSLTLPSLTVALYLSPVLVRMLRASMILTLRAEHVDAARARGLSETRVLLRYVLRNSLTSTLTLVGASVGVLIAGSVVVENVFAVPGMGQLLVNSVAKRDFPVIQACVFIIGVFVVAVSLVTDLANAAMDPRTRR